MDRELVQVVALIAARLLGSAIQVHVVALTAARLSGSSFRLVAGGTARHLQMVRICLIR
jgi:hypothetical protein